MGCHLTLLLSQGSSTGPSFFFFFFFRDNLICVKLHVKVWNHGWDYSVLYDFTTRTRTSILVTIRFRNKNYYFCPKFTGSHPLLIYGVYNMQTQHLGRRHKCFLIYLTGTLFFLHSTLFRDIKYLNRFTPPLPDFSQYGTLIKFTGTFLPCC